MGGDTPSFVQKKIQDGARFWGLYKIEQPALQTHHSSHSAMDDSQDSSDSIDRECNQALDELEEQATNAFHFDFIPYEDRRCTKFGVHRRTFTTRLQQRGGDLARLLPNHALPELIEHTLEMAIDQQILNDPTAREMIGSW